MKGNGAGHQQHVALQYDTLIVVVDAKKEAAYARDHLLGVMSFGRVQRRPQRNRDRRLGGFFPLIDAFRINVQRPRGGLGRTALLG